MIGLGEIDGAEVLVRFDAREIETGAFYRLRYRVLAGHDDAGHDDGHDDGHDGGHEATTAARTTGTTPPGSTSAATAGRR